MPKNFTTAAKTAKNTPNSTDEALWLFELQLIGTDVALFLVRNNENVTVDGNVYKAFPIEIEQITEGSEGNIPSTRLTVSNVTQELLAILEHHGGFVDQTVIARIVFTSDLNNPILVGRWTITEATVDTQSVSFTVEPPAIYDEDFPKRRSHPTCSWRYQDEATCGFPTQAKVDATPALSGLVVPPRCSRTLDGDLGCRSKNTAFVDAGLTAATWTLNGESVTGSQWPKRYGGKRSIPRRRE